MIEDITVEAKRCTCDKCGYQWRTLRTKPALHCQNKQCESREWNGKKQLIKSHINEIKLPKPRKGGRPKVKTDSEEDE